MRITTANDSHGYRIGQEGFLTPSEAAELTSMSTRTLARLADEGHLRRVRLSHKTVRYCRRSILDWFAKHED